jgi:hypothetical protein
MIQDILCVSNVFENPEEIIDLAKKQRFYSCEENPSIKNTNIKYKGERTLQLHGVLREEDYFSLTEKIVKKIFQHTPSAKVTLQPICLFHHLTENDIPDKNWLHRDTSLYSGVIYLNKTFIDKFNNHGTKIIKNGEEINIKNEFNKLVLYRGDYLHSANFGFGDYLDNSRLTLNFFINEISILINNENKVKEKHYDYKT